MDGYVLWLMTCVFVYHASCSGSFHRAVNCSEGQLCGYSHAKHFYMTCMIVYLIAGSSAIGD